MKKFLPILLVVLLVTGIAFAATPGFRQDPGTGDILGQGKYQSDPHKIFRMVRYQPSTCATSSTMSKDSIVIWDTTSDDGITVTTTTTSYDSAVAGIIVTQALTPDLCSRTAANDVGGRNWTWLQTYGLSQTNVDPLNTGPTVKAAMATSTREGEATTFIGGGTSSLTQGMAGFFYDTATAGDDDVEVFINGLD